MRHLLHSLVPLAPVLAAGSDGAPLDLATPGAFTDGDPSKDLSVPLAAVET
jgi:hypothetical protein